MSTMSTGKLILWGAVGIAGIFGTVYLVRKLLREDGGAGNPAGFGNLLVKANPKELPALGQSRGRKDYNLEVEGA